MDLTTHLYKGLYIEIDKDKYFPLKVSNIVDNILFILSSIKKKNFQIIRVKDNNNKIKGSRIIRRKFDKQILIINNKQEKVYRFYSNKDQFERVKNGHQTLEQFYNIISIKFHDNLLAEEEFFKGKLLSKASATQQLEIFNQIVERYHNTVLENNFEKHPARISPEEFFVELEKTLYPQEMKLYLHKHKETVKALIENLTWTWAHADLTPHNVLFNKNSYKIIDSELCEVMPVYYDISNLMYTSVRMCNNKEFYKSFFDGSYDKILKRSYSKDEVSIFERGVFALVMLFLKNILQRDPANKNSNHTLMNNRWQDVKNYIIKE